MVSSGPCSSEMGGSVVLPTFSMARPGLAPTSILSHHEPLALQGNLSRCSIRVILKLKCRGSWFQGCRIRSLGVMPEEAVVLIKGRHVFNSMATALKEHLSLQIPSLFTIPGSGSSSSRFCFLKQVQTVTLESHRRHQVQMTGLASERRTRKKTFSIPLIPILPICSCLIYTIKAGMECDIGRLS